MSLPPPKSAADEDKTSLGSADIHHERRDSVALIPSAPKKANRVEVGNGYLSAPLSGPIRPMSPDTLSNLSAEEYEQIQPGRPSHSLTVDATPPLAKVPHPRGVQGSLQRFWVRNKGLAYVLLGQVFGSLMNVTTRLLEVEGNKGKGLHPFQILFARMGITFVLATGYMWWNKTPHFPFGMKEVRWLLVLRGFGGFFGVFGMYYSLLYLPLADATVITFLSPAIACWACSFLIKEPFTRIERIAALISLVGVVLIARPTSLFALHGDDGGSSANGSGDAMPSGNSTALPVSGGPDASSYENVTPMQRLSAVGIALIGVLGGASAFITIRWIGKRAHPLITVNYFSGWCTVVSTVMMFALPGVGFLLPADLKEWGYLFFLGACGFIMQFLFAAGLAYEKSSRATNMTYSSMLFALAFDKIIFGHTPGIMSIMGSSLILGSAIVVAMQRSPDSSHNENAHQDPVTNADDPESQVGLISGDVDVESGEDHDRLPLQEVQLRALR